MTDYDVVAFDMDGVLLTRGDTHWRPNAVAAADRALQEPRFDIDPTKNGYTEFRDALVDLYFNDDTAYFDAVREHAATYGVAANEVWERTEHHAVKIQQEQLRDENDGRQIHGDITALHELGQRYGMAVVSNNAQGFVKHVVSCPDLAEDVPGCETLEDIFDVAYGVQHDLDDRQNRKPEPYYLNRLQERYGTEDILYVGDSIDDILAAHRAGIDSAFVDYKREDTEQRAEELLDGVEPTIMVSALTDLTEL